MNWLLTAVLNWAWGKLYAFLSALWKKKQREEQIQREAEASVDPLKKAETKEEIDAATDDALRRL